MTEVRQERRINRSTNQREALNNLLDFTRLKGGFDQALIVDDDGELVATSIPIGDAAALAPMAWVLQKAAGTLSGPASFKKAETIIIQVSEGKSLACHFIRDWFEGAILATIDGKMPPSTEKILAGTAESYMRIMTKR
ncbi:hypothetical protein [Desulfoluna sp.]|uniref:hypothetical protein n=1 Tax=Desulfoluna sp. TaxID=2045199 RepID=UPI0026345EF1|nr:hypothetical protein [Desulfoluna sp.]